MAMALHELKPILGIHPGHDVAEIQEEEVNGTIAKVDVARGSISITDGSVFRSLDLAPGVEVTVNGLKQPIEQVNWETLIGQSFVSATLLRYLVTGPEVHTAGRLNSHAVLLTVTRSH